MKRGHGPRTARIGVMGIRKRHLALLLLPALLGGCATGPGGGDGHPRLSLDPDHIEDAVPRHEPRARSGNKPVYEVFGKRYRTLESARGFEQTGIASWYGTKFHGRPTASGEIYDVAKMTAAHKHLPLPTYVEVTNLENGRKAIVKVNDRGPFHGDRIIDLSYAAAVKLGFAQKGTARVRIRAIDPSAPPPTKTAGAEKPLYLQVGSFSSRVNAETLRRLIEETMREPVPVQISQAPDRTLYRVRVGPLEDPGEAERIGALLTLIGIERADLVYD